MASKVLDCKGLKSPLPTLKMLAVARMMTRGDVLEVVADCPTFEYDVRQWCRDTKRALLWFKQEGSQMHCQVRV